MNDEKKMVELNADEAEKVVGGGMSCKTKFDEAKITYSRTDRTECTIRKLWMDLSRPLLPDQIKKRFLKSLGEECSKTKGRHCCSDDCPFYQAWKNNQ